MSTKRKRAKRGNYSRREQRQITLVVTVLFTLSVAAIAMMAVVNRLPIGRRYTYTEASDLWIRDGGEMQIAAPELILFTEEPDPTPTPTESPEPTQKAVSDAIWGTFTATGADAEWESDMTLEDETVWESSPETDAESSPEVFAEPDAAPSDPSDFPLPEGA